MPELTELESVKLYCRVDGNDENELFTDLIKAAKALIVEQSGKQYYVGEDGEEKTPMDQTELFRTCVKQLVAHWYDSRGATDNVAQQNIPFTVDMMIAHFKYSKNYKGVL